MLCDRSLYASHVSDATIRKLCVDTLPLLFFPTIYFFLSSLGDFGRNERDVDLLAEITALTFPPNPTAALQHCSAVCSVPQQNHKAQQDQLLWMLIALFSFLQLFLLIWETVASTRGLHRLNKKNKMFMQRDKQYQYHTTSFHIYYYK